ncbi:MAG TPA: O-antigen ligase family protein [Pyrinomonadaceae bacterium]|jgi:hypothetical protein
MKTLAAAAVPIDNRLQRRSTLLWFLPLQAAAAFSVLAIVGGGQMLRTWLLGALLWLMGLPLLVSLEAGLLAMIVFEPLRGLLRRAQYLFLEYAAEDPIHVLTPIVTIFALAALLRLRRLSILHGAPLAGSVSILALIYILEIFNPLQGGLLVGLAGALFMLPPLIWFYFGQSIDDKFLTRALQIMIALGLLTSLYGVYQLTVGYPAFEQYWIDNTEFYESIGVGHVQRALATFSSAEEWGRYAEIGAIAAFGFVGGAKTLRARIGWLLCGAALLGGVLLTGERTAVFGLIVGVATLILLGARTLPSAFIRGGLVLLPIVLVVVFVAPPSDEDMWSKGEDETVSTLLSHTQRGTLKPADEESFQVRLENWEYLLTDVIPYRPLGMGLGAGSLGSARFSRDGDLPPVDSFVLIVAITSGIPAALLFICILARATWLSWTMARADEADSQLATVKRTAAALMPALILNSIFGLTFTLYSVAPIAWLLIGWIGAESLRAKQPQMAPATEHFEI